MSDVVVSRMDIRSVVRAIERVDNRTIEIDSQVDALSGHQIELRNELQNLAQAFREFVAADKHAKALQLAETRIVKVRQEIETRFGFYGVVRRRATGILQGIDSGVVTHDVVRNLTEDMMVSAPGYWLAPALVALASWARDDQRLAARALDEALIRDSFRTSLFFALVTRRLRRDVASASWLTQYFRHQDPMALDREFMVLLDAVANGAFG
ncbi:MAG: hypothetical protein K8I02_03470, partial [Candidatus Methylomirabilis sp.]|nr:hypothetical protein [Deltaproteobacteria bacterium]